MKIYFMEKESFDFIMVGLYFVDKMAGGSEIRMIESQCCRRFKKKVKLSL
jgi:hypothetical protein